jgi:ABC-type antimicrobial peptide transport system permease subunit
VREVLREALLVIGSGLAIGTAAALLLSRLLAAQLFGVSATDPVTFLSVLAFLGAVALAAALLPAWRASRVNPLTALRGE